MTLGGLAAVIGVVVDDAIITVENILRRMREHRAKIKGLPPPATKEWGEGGGEGAGGAGEL